VVENTMLKDASTVVTTTPRMNTATRISRSVKPGLRTED
jgi:hypothetical protein